ncbi:MAG: hypothetical protein HFF29_08305 [Oscillospiraceae bacterium]|nr:hypothetical protein [Oscillospiraceae bacterium]
MKKSSILCLAAGLALALLAGCAGEKAPEPSAPPSAPPAQSQAAQPTPTPEPVSTPAPSAEPTSTPVPSVEPAPTPVPSVEPTSTPQPSAEATAAPAPQGPEDGNYTANVTLSGGTGRASIQSPAKLRCTNGQFTATIQWSSPNFDYMKVNGTRYDLISAPGADSAFEIPVAAFDMPLPVIADTIAMSEPHEVEYAITFDSASLTKQ